MLGTIVNSLVANSNQRGITLVEVMIAIAIIAIVAAIAVPSYQSQIARQNLVLASENLVSDIKFARSEALKRSDEVEFAITSGANWSYVISDSTSNEIKNVSSSNYSGISGLTLTNLASGAFSFDGVRGLANVPTNTTVSFSASGDSATVVINVVGRAWICDLSGYEDCP
jgi:prepilin-type N-terminal cleavage/methylation domain-containing protein